MCKPALVSHAAGKKHMALTAKVQMIFKPKAAQQDSQDSENPSTSKDDNTCIIKENPPEKVQSTLHLFINIPEKTKAEIIWTLKSITCGYSSNSCSDMIKLFRSMFPDSTIAKSFQLNADEIRYMTNYTIAPNFKDLLFR